MIWFAVAWAAGNLAVYELSHLQADMFTGMGDMVIGAIAFNALVLAVGLCLSALVARRVDREVFSVYLVVAVFLPAIIVVGLLLLIFH